MSVRRTATVARADAEAAARLRLVIARLARAIRQQATAGLTPSQLSALAALEERGAVRMSELAAAESVAASVATRVVDSLVKLGYVTRSADERDGRACLIELSPAGRRVLQEIWHARAAALTDRIAALPPADAAVLIAALPVLEALVHDAG
jgi:DNA-binding MarR family transcriptional regulator